MGCAAALHPSLEHRGLFDFFLGVEAPDEGAGVEVIEGIVEAVSDDPCADSVGVELLDGDETFKVDDSSSLSSPTVVEGSNGFESSMSCTSAGKFVEAERNSRTFETV
jgi:hypothetical protein